MPAENPPRDENPRPGQRQAGRPTAVRRPTAPPGYSSTTYGRSRPARERPAEQEKPLAPLSPPRPGRNRDGERARATAPPPRPPRSGSTPSRRRRRRRLLPAVLVVVALAVAYPATLGWRAWSQVEEVAATSTGERPAATAGTTFLIVGSDSRDGMTEEEKQEYSAGGDDIHGRRTDTIMLLHVPSGGGPAALISIPRDSYVPIPGHNSNKINAAFSIGGAPLLAETIEDVSGLRIDHYVETGFAGFAGIVDAVGGVEMCPDVAVQDVRAGLDIQAGCQDMNGLTALGYARYRYSDPLGDLGRANRQRQLLSAIMSRATSPTTLLNPFRAYPLAGAGGRSVTLDDEANPLELLTFARGMRSATGADGISMTVPVSDPNYRTSAGLAVKWNTEQALQMFDDLKRDDTEALRSLTA